MGKNWLARALLLCSLLWARSACANPVGVIFPELPEPYDRVFAEIMDGIDDHLDQPTERHVLERNFNSAEIEQALNGSGHEVVIALGQRAVEAISQINPNVPVVYGAVLPSTNDTEDNMHPVIYMVPSPERLFEQLLLMQSTIEEIFVVYNPQKNQFLIQRGQDAAKKLGLSLNALPVQSLKEAAQLYKDLSTKMDPKKTALWLLQDSTTIDSDTILSALLSESWERNLVIFSSNLSHVSRGILFSLFPDNFKMGQALADLANEVRKKPKLNKIMVLRELKLAVNMRTASHLGIRLSERDIELVFPRR